MKSASPLRVMYFDHTAMLGGGEVALLNLIRKVDRAHVHPLVVLGCDGPLANELRSIAEVHILALPDEVRRAPKDQLSFRTLLQVGQFFQAAWYVRTLVRFIRQNRIDIVHTNSLKADILGGVAARIARTPLIWHIRDRIENDYLPAPVVKIVRVLARLVPTIIVANSAATMKTLSPPSPSGDSSLHKPERWIVIHDGTTLPLETETSVNERSPQIVLIGRICPWKGQDVFIKAAALVRARFPNARFKIVGAALFGEEEYESSIRELCSQQGLDDVVEFTGFCPDVSLILRDLDVLVHASTLGEPFGQVIIEGMAAAKPVVATNGGGVPEIVLHKETGLLVPMGSVAEMADAICELLASPLQRAAMGRKGRERVQNHFTMTRTVEKVDAVYSKIAAKRNSEAGHFQPSQRGPLSNSTPTLIGLTGRNMTYPNNELDISSIVLRRWRNWLLWSAPFAVLFIAIVLLLPKKYASEMTILVNNERQDPVISTDYAAYMPQARDESELRVNSESLLLRSTDVLKDVVLGAGLVKESSPSSSGGVSPLELNRAIEKLDRRLTIEPVRKSQMISVSYLASSPELANRVLRLLARRYFEVHVQVHNTNGTYQLFDDQAVRYASGLDQSEVELTAFRRNNSLLVTPEEQQLLALRATETRAAFEDSDAQIAQLERRLKEGAKAIANLNDRVVTQQRLIPDSDLAQRLSATLVDLKNRRTELTSKFRADDRLVVQLDAQIAETQATLDRANASSHTEQTTDLNAVRQASEKDFMADSINLAGMTARREKLKADLMHYREDMAQLAGATVKHEALVRKVKENEDNYLLYSKKREQARIESVLDQGRVANVAIAQQPTLTAEPASPNLLLAIPIALVLAICTGIAIVCGSEYTERKKTLEEEPFMDRRVAVAG
jgi:glycosyltransferase involved in cell wall biosynthesis/uncharacterized protein involved in exopolysaccharide biosynthesis